MKREEREKLIRLALETMKKAYAPYSRFYVGAALLAASGKIYCGFNIENAAFTPTMCAERAAFAKALTEGETSFTAIAVAGGKDRIPSEIPTPPCGVCRQFMREFCGADFLVITTSGPDNCREFRLSELLPESFGPENL